MLNNVVKGWITSLIGVIFIIGTYASVEVYHVIDWVYNGLIGLAVGCIFLFMPDQIPKILAKVISKEEEKV